MGSIHTHANTAIQKMIIYPLINLWWHPDSTSHFCCSNLLVLVIRRRKTLNATFSRRYKYIDEKKNDWKNLFSLWLHYDDDIIWSLVAQKILWSCLQSLQIFSLHWTQKCVAILYGMSGQVPQSIVMIMKLLLVRKMRSTSGQKRNEKG